MIYNVYSDCHKRGVAEEEGVSFRYDLERTIYLADNHEFKNIPKDMIDLAQKDYDLHIMKCKQNGCIEIRGNHEVNRSMGVDFHIVDNVLFTHGHHIFYSSKKIKKWESREAGRGAIGRFFSKIIAKGRHIIKMNKFSNKKKKKIEKYIIKMRNKGYKFDTLIFGHTHPSKMIVDRILGVKIINVKQGYTRVMV